jgi:4-hydroxy-tetrahydrodipicolinate synthase
MPYYNRPMPAGVLAHFRTIAASTGLPIILHDNPARTIREISDETILRLSESPQFMGLNESSILPEGFRLLGGNDANAMAYLACGGDGCVSVVANLFPDLCRRSYDCCLTGNVRVARDASSRLAALGMLLAGEAPVAALKYGMSLLGFMHPPVRLPLVELDQATRDAIASAVMAAGESSRNDRASQFARTAAYSTVNVRSA